MICVCEKTEREACKLESGGRNLQLREPRPSLVNVGRCEGSEDEFEARIKLRERQSRGRVEAVEGCDPKVPKAC